MLKAFQKIPSHARQGKAFETMIRASLKRLAENSENKLWFTRLWDYRSFIKLNPAFHAIKQPGDFLVCSNGKFYIIECKSSQAYRFNLDVLRNHQLQTMKQITQAGGHYWLLVLHRSEERAKHKLFAFDYSTWLKLCDSVKKSGFKTADWKIVEMCAKFELVRSKGVWDLFPLFKGSDNNEQKGI